MVTGFTRSGTSMMMNCLIAGGMDAEYVESYEGLKYKTVDGYHGNPQGYRELEESEVKRPDFPECYAGKLIKMPNYWWMRQEAETYDEVWYPVAVFNPLPVFEMLQDHGWPIDPEKSAKIPDPKYYHFRNEAD